MTDTTHDLPYGERRGIPIETLNYINASIDAGFEKARETMMTKTDFAAHDKAELARYDTIIKNQTAESTVQKERYVELKTAIDRYSEKSEAFRDDIKEAFLVTRHGKPDYLGHANAHQSWIEDVSDNKKLLKDIRMGIVVALSIAIINWLVPPLWNNFLKGPVTEQSNAAR